MASFDRSVPPGGEGKITLKFNTNGYYGPVTKSARVFSNDSTRRVQTLSIKATVRTPIYISPRSVYFKGRLGQKMERTIQITAKQEKALKIKPEKFDLEKIVSFKIKEIEKGKQYQLLFTASPETPGSFRGTLKLSTNYPEKPEISIPITGTVQRSLQNVKPNQNG